ncbi:MAG: hypothetical protein ABH878_06885 [bacterium]
MDAEMLDRYLLAVLILDQSGKAIFVNQAFTTAWEVDKSVILEQPGYNIFDDPLFQNEDIRNELKLAFQGNPLSLRIHNYHLLNGFSTIKQETTKSKSVLFTCIPCAFQGKQAYLVVIHTDESLIDLEEEYSLILSRIEVLQKSFGLLKHKINNPLQVIIGHAQILLTKHSDLPVGVIQRIEKILNNAERIMEYTESDSRFFTEPRDLEITVRTVATVDDILC